MNALLLPSEGKVYVDGMDTLQEDLIWEIRSKAGMVFQNPDNQLVATIVEEDVAFGPENLGVPSDEIRARVDECLKTVNMFEYRNMHLTYYQWSKAKSLYCRYMAMRPDCIMNEPTAMLILQGEKKL